MKADLMLQAAERDARQLRSEYLHDLLVRAVIAVDLAIRRAACRILSASARMLRPHKQMQA